MSRMTSAQVIALGEYLEPDFNPASLTVSQLLGVLGYHNIPYPTPYSKPKLTLLFNDEIKGRANKFKKERLKKANSFPSDDGITDGVTGMPLNGAKKDPAPFRRSTRRLSQAPIEIEDSPPSLPQRRRSSAQPSLGTLSRRKVVAKAQSILAEESEPEEESLPPKKVGRSKKTSEASQPRRISDAVADDSGWEDNNIFQSGAESSSPARPSPVRVKVPRTSGIPKRSRKSMSAPPHMIDSSPSRSSPFSPQISFNPAIGRIPPLRFSPSPRQVSKLHAFQPQEQDADELNVIDGTKEGESGPSIREEDETNALSNEDETSDFGEESDLADSTTRQNDESMALAVLAEPGGVLSLVYRLTCLSLLAALGYALINYKLESASIGFCDLGATTNSVLEAMLAMEACIRDNRTTLHLPSLRSSPSLEVPIPCPLPPLFPLPHPNSCTACPQHATCAQFSVQCDNGYVRRPHLFFSFLPDPPSSSDLPFSSSLTPSELVWTGLSRVLNGLPGMGSIALPPRCTLDPKRQRNIGVLGKAMESILSQERGRRLCVGGEELEREYKDPEGGEARKWGVEIEQLREMMKRKTSPRLKVTFDDTFNEAIQELVQWGGVVFGADKEDHRYLASRDADLTWDCVLTVKSREFWETWRTTALGGAVALFTVILGRLKVAQKQSESRRVGELVQIALDTLRNQELAHHTDPVVTPQPYLSSIQLRDVILQNEHAIPTRRRLWDQVEHIVEGNANVRANLEEIEGGDELRVWRWVGSTGRGLM